MSWQQVPLRRIFRIINGGTPTNDEDYWNGDVPWATPVDIGSVNGSYLASTQRNLSDEGVRTGSQTVPSGSLVLSTRAPIGYVAQATRTMAFNQGCRGLVPVVAIDPRYFRYQLIALREELSSRGAGSTFMELSTDALAAVPVLRPPLDEQRRIADFLDAETAHIHSLVMLRENQLKLLDELALGVIDDAIERVPHPVTIRLGYLAQVQTGITVDGNRQHDGDVVTLPYLRVANVQVGRVDLDDVADITVPRRATAANRLRPGDVLMTEGGDLDKLGRGTVWRGEIEACLHQNHVFAVRPDINALNPEYLALLTRAPMARKYFESTGNKTTNLASTSSSKIRDFRIPMTDTGTQRAIVKDVDARLRSVSQFEEQLTQQLSVLAERRQALITAAITGQIDVTTARGVTV
ncbi:MAG: restriction endonuclease subunit S [Pseudonocardiales bacterium]